MIPNEDTLRLIGYVIKGKGDALPATSDFIGQMFVKTGTASPGLYVATAAGATPAWKAVEHAA